MAKDYVKDGYELTEDGKAIPLAESKSVVLTDPEAIEGEVIEGNLYVDAVSYTHLDVYKRQVGNNAYLSFREQGLLPQIE